MKTPILKSHWERTKEHFSLTHTVAQELVSPWTPYQIENLELLSNGCGNTNYKVIFSKNMPPVVLRIYLRDSETMPIEQAIYHLVEKHLPVPKFLYSNNSYQVIPYSYAIVEWVDGILMRQVLLEGKKQAIQECAFEAGTYLNVLRNITFSTTGFFKEDLSIKPFKEEEQYIPFILKLLESTEIRGSLSPSLIKDLQKLVVYNEKFLPDMQPANLTHGDYDPANMLVNRIKGTWKISANLDWEFAFSGSYFFDMGNMLRYAHKLPKIYEESFIHGLTSYGLSLPTHWKATIKLLDLLSLLLLLYKNPLNKRPNMGKDITTLLENTMHYLNACSHIK